MYNNRWLEIYFLRLFLSRVKIKQQSEKLL